MTFLMVNMVRAVIMLLVLYFQLDDDYALDLVFYFLNHMAGQATFFHWLIEVNFSSTTDSCPCFLYRSEHRFHASSVGENTHPTALIACDGYNYGNYYQQSFLIRHGQQFQQYNNMTSSSIRPIATHHNGPPVWNNYSSVESPPTNVGNRMPWGKVLCLRFLLSM
jgi:dual specificity protein kinase YAK1